MLDRDRHAVARETVPAHLAVVAVTAPHAMIVPFDDVRHEPVAAERRFDPVGRREREVVGEEDVVVGPAGAAVHGALPRPQEEPVAAVRDRVPGDDVVAALLVHEEPGRVLSAAVPAVRVAAHVVVHAILHDHVPARAIQPDAEPGVEREGVVAYGHAVGSRHEERVHPLLGAIAPDLAAGDVLEIDRRPEPHPLALLVLVVREPVDQTLVPHEREEPRLPVVREIVLAEREPARPAREHGDPIPADGRPPDRDPTPAVDAHRHALPGIGQRIERGPFEPHPAHVDRDPLTAHDHQRRVERGVRRQPIRPRPDPHRRCDRHPRREWNRSLWSLCTPGSREQGRGERQDRNRTDHRYLLGGTSSAPNNNPAVNASNALSTATSVSNPTA